MGVVAADAALNEPERRVRLGSCSGAPCVWCQDGFDAVCPGPDTTIVHDDACNVDDASCPTAPGTCDCTETCSLDASSTTFTGEVVMMVDDAPCGADQGLCGPAGGNGSVTKLALCGRRADNTTFALRTTKIDCCRSQTGTTGSVQCNNDGCGTPRRNPFLCDQENRNCGATGCCITENVNQDPGEDLPDAQWLTLQLFPASMSAAIQTAVPGTGLPVITAATVTSTDDHSADAQPTVKRYQVTVGFITPPTGFSTEAPDCTFSQLQAPPFDGSAPCSFCGDGEVDPGEACDAGAANGSADSCCDSTCKAKPAGTACGNGGVCDAGGHCGAGGIGVFGRKLIIRDRGTLERYRLRWWARDAGIALANLDLLGTDSRLLGATDGRPSNASASALMPASGWTEVKPGRFRYRDRTNANGPVTSAKVKDGALSVVLEAGPFLPILVQPPASEIAIAFDNVVTRYCSLFPGSQGVVTRNDPDAGAFKAESAAPTASDAATCLDLVD